MKLKYIICFFLFTTLLYSETTVDKDRDSIRTYKLGEVNVSGYQDRSKIELSRYDVNYFQIQNSDIISMNQMEMLIPSGKIRINSRGESMPFLRGAGERQLGLFFDGVQMNIPWDLKFDLTLIPTDIIGKLNVNKNAGSILYGPNVLGGAINISTLERQNEGFGANVKLQTNDIGAYNAAISTDGKIGGFNYIANISYYKSKGYKLSANVPKDRDSVLYQDFDSDYIINSDIERLTGYIRGEYRFSELTAVGVSALNISGEKGVRPQTNKDGKARFWRYPEFNRTLITTNFVHNFSNTSETGLRATLWYDKFNQGIDNYTDSSYSTIKVSKDGVKERYKFEDITYGARLAFQYELMKGQILTAIYNGFTSAHNDNEIKLVKYFDYSQNTMNAGIDYNGTFENLNVNAGIGYDMNETPKTGEFKDAEGTKSTDYAAFLNLNYTLNDNFGLFGNISRRTRFAALRELYSAAINKQVINPDLKPESGILSEIGAYLNYDSYHLRVSFFNNHYEDMITNIQLTKEQDSLKRKMRTNVGTANIYGFDVSFKLFPLPKLYMFGNLTYMMMNGVQEGIDVKHFDNKPEFVGGLTVVYQFPYNIELAAEADLAGRQWETVDLKKQIYNEVGATTVFNIRASIQFNDFDFGILEVFARANNIFDIYRLSEIGIPEDGRTIWFGASVRL